MLTQQQLKEYLHYDTETGIFTWLIAKSKSIKAGEIAGHMCKFSGYVFIRIDRKNYRAHRLAWLYVTGEMPSIIDHIDGNKKNNSFINLRVANKFQNGMNIGILSNNKTNFKGVSYCKLNKKFRAQAKVFGVNKTLGYFKTAIEASNKYNEFVKVLHGDFYRETVPCAGS